MNANKLADKLDKLDTKIMIKGLNLNDLLSAELCDQAATMLRQQQAKLTKYELRHAEQRKRIDELEKQLAFMEGEYPEPTIMAKMMEVDLVRQQQAEIEALKAGLEWIVGVNALGCEYQQKAKETLKKAQKK